MQQFAIVGVEQQSCPVEIRELVALEGQAEIVDCVQTLQERGVDEILVLSTCARTELYLWSDSNLEVAIATASDYFVELNPRSRDFLSYRRREAAVTHLFRVTSGLESQVVGEEEVTGQVRKAIELAREQGGVGPNLDALFRSAVACSRRVRRESKPSQRERTVAAAAASLARTRGPLTDLSVLVIGSGRVARMLAREFSPARQLTMASRNPDTLSEPAEKLGARVLGLAEALESIDSFDIVCSATRSKRPLLRASDFKGASSGLVFDLGMPRNVETDVGNVFGVTLYDIDDIRPTDGEESQNRELVAGIVAAEVHDFVSRQTLRAVAPIIAALRSHVEHVRDQEIVRIRPRLSGLDDAQRAAVESLVQRLMDRMFHHLVVRLKLAALTDADLVRAAEFFFAHGDDSLFPETVPDEAAAEATLLSPPT